MSSSVRSLIEKDLITPPSFVATGLQYEVITGSYAYGVANDDSDYDINGFCIPPKEMVFPHLNGEISGFGIPKEKFFQYQKHHIIDPSMRGGRGREYDITIYSIVKFFQLCMDNNPNMLDLLFVADDCILFKTHIADMVRERSEIFVHKGCYLKFRGYAYSQLQKIKSRSNTSNPKRRESIEKFGYDVKFAYHIVRLLLEVEQLLQHRWMDLRKHATFLKGVRNGFMTLKQVQDFFSTSAARLDQLYNSSTIPEFPDEEEIKQLLLECLEEKFGSISNMLKGDDSTINTLKQIRTLADEKIIAYNRKSDNLTEEEVK